MPRFTFLIYVACWLWKHLSLILLVYTLQDKVPISYSGIEGFSRSAFLAMLYSHDSSLPGTVMPAEQLFPSSPCVFPEPVPTVCLECPANPCQWMPVSPPKPTFNFTDTSGTSPWLLQPVWSFPTRGFVISDGANRVANRVVVGG